MMQQTYAKHFAVTLEDDATDLRKTFCQKLHHRYQNIHHKLWWAE
jgi:hypothetical protein